ncbi:MAG: isoprenylcysteine carboxylmethyltransferase family protein [Acidobacteriota bacterium]|nr:isoprenylcysteine carboxylmethyltransferase family protein [Acidobacteriota bacterium]
MRPLVFVWPYALIFWVTYAWAFAPEGAMVARSSRAAAENHSKDSGSLRLIVVGMWIGLLLSFPIAFVTALRFPLAANLAAFCIGTGLLIAGSLLRRHCWRILGEYFTGDVRARADQPVIDRGAYRWVRHPSYTGGILMFGGIGIALANWASLAILTLVSVAVYSYRIAVEERALIQTIGEPYATYMRTRKRFVPFII